MKMDKHTKDDQLEHAKENWSAFTKSVKWVIIFTSACVLLLGMVFADLF